MNVDERRSLEPADLIYAGVEELVEDAPRRTERIEEPPQAGRSYRLALGRETLHLDPIEFRILLLLASRPYHPFSRRHIAEAVSTERYPLTEDTVDEHIASLRVQLRCFRDYIRTVPFLGYRFKA